MSIVKRFEEMNIHIPNAAKPIAAYLPAVKSGKYIYISGQLPIQNGKVLYEGKIGKDISIQDGKEAARLACINCLAALKNEISDWEDIVKIVKVTGYVNCLTDFTQHPLVINGASEILVEIFQDRGRHARAAVGVNSLPLNACCEIDMIVEIK